MLIQGLKDGQPTNIGVTDNRLDCVSVNLDHLAYNSKYSQNVNSVHMHHEIQASWVYEYIGYIIYTGTKNLVISKLTYTSEEVADTKWHGCFFFPESADVLSGGVDPLQVNMNRTAKSKLISMNAKHSNEGTSIITCSDAGEHPWCGRKNGTDTISFDTRDSLIMGPNDIFLAACKGTTVGIKLTFTAICFEEDL